MKPITKTSVLFDKRNLDLNTPYSLVNFTVDDQVTINAVNLHPDDVITFEVLHIKAGTLPEACEYSCYIKPGEMPKVDGSTPLLCDECDDGGAKLQVRLTVHNPLVILDSPQGVVLRAVYDGPGIGDATVWSVSGTDTAGLTPAMQGCPVECCVPDPNSFTGTGIYRCVLATDKVEEQFVDNCGNTEWREVADIDWQPTGNRICLRDWDLANGVPGTMQVEMRSDCGDLKWVDGGDQTWTRTGAKKCDPDGETMHYQVSNNCGDLDWITEVDQEWTDTGAERCENKLVQRQQVNQCGEIRWEDTAEHCGYFATLYLPCSGAAYRPGEQPPDATVAVEDCDGNVLGYIYPEPQGGATTPVIEGCDSADCDTGGPVLGYAVDAANPSCDGKVTVHLDDYLYVAKMPDLKASGVESGLADVADAIADLKNCEDNHWEPTGEVRCNPDGVTTSVQETNRCGHLRWVNGVPQQWDETGQTRCEGNLVQRQEVNQCGNLRWVNTAEHCGYHATMRLPCEGYAFLPGAQPPDATVALEDCDGNVIAYVYAAPRQGATTPVAEGCEGSCDTGTVIGYAVDGVHATCDKLVVHLDDYVSIGSMPAIKAPGLEQTMLGVLQALNEIANALRK